MNLEELRSVQDAERRKSDLQPLRESFYAEAGDYIADLKTERSRAAERADDPFSSPEVRRLSDEIDTAEEVLEAIYDRRMGKLLKRASLEASDMSVENDGLTAEEQALFEDLVERIAHNKEQVLETLAGERTGDAASGSSSGPGSESPPAETSPEPDPAGSEPGGQTETPPDAVAADDPPADPPDAGTEAVDAAGAMGTGSGESSARHEVDPAPAPEAVAGDPPDRDSREGSPDPDPDPTGNQADTDGGSGAAAGASLDSGVAVQSSGSPRGDDTERVMVRITDEVGAIYGVDDREYDLSSEDVVTLPSKNAEPLVQRGAAERLD